MSRSDQRTDGSTGALWRRDEKGLLELVRAMGNISVGSWWSGSRPGRKPGPHSPHFFFTTPVSCAIPFLKVWRADFYKLFVLNDIEKTIRVLLLCGSGISWS